MSNLLENQLVYNVANAPLRPFPYPHIYVPNVFPPELYAEIQRHMPDPAAMLPIAEARPVRGYKERFVLDPAQHMERLPADQANFWSNLRALLLKGMFRASLIEKFHETINRRFAGQTVQFSEETLLVEDQTHYALGPHTDTPAKVITVLFYLPKDESQSHLGTSIYMPKDRKWTCPGGPHHTYDMFDRVATMPFMPNSMFAFVKTDKSFHGVEPVLDPDTRRWLLLYDIKGKVVQAAAPPPPKPAGPQIIIG